MAESDLNKRICAAIRALDPVRVENPVCPGTPDISYAWGWIEDRQIEFPKRTDTIIKIPHYTPQQRAWHVRRRRAGGLCWVALEETRGQLFIFDALDAASHLGVNWNADDCMYRAKFYLPAWDAVEFRAFINSCKP